MQFKKLHADAVVPSYAHNTDVGMDVHTIEHKIVLPGERAIFSTGIAFAVPEGYAALVWDKSGIAIKRGLKVLGGVFDPGYTGELLICLHNLGTESQAFSVGDKIAQIIIQKIEQPELEEVDDFPNSERGENRFGSTGN